MNAYTVNTTKELVNQRLSAQNSQDEFSFVSEGKDGIHLKPTHLNSQVKSRKVETIEGGFFMLHKFLIDI